MNQSSWKFLFRIIVQTVTRVNYAIAIVSLVQMKYWIYVTDREIVIEIKIHSISNDYYKRQCKL